MNKYFGQAADRSLQLLIYFLKLMYIITIIGIECAC